MSGCRVITIKVISTSRICAGTPLFPAVGHGCGPAGVSHVNLNTGCATPPGKMDGYSATICACGAAGGEFITLVRKGTIAPVTVVACAGSAPATFGTTARNSVVPFSWERIQLTPLPKSVSTIKSKSPGVAQVPPPAVPTKQEETG